MSEERIVVEAPVAPTGADRDTLIIDVGNLAAHDPSPTNAVAYQADAKEAMLEAARDITQTLIDTIFSLPVTVDPNIGPLAKLPPPTTALPRMKPLPKGKPDTKWQKFAKEKGIVKRNKSKMVWDESANAWKRRHGYDKAGDEKDTIVVNAKRSDAPGHDPFAEALKAKKERVAKNKKQQERNLRGGANAVAPSLALTASLPFEGSRSGAQGKKLLRGNVDDAKIAKDVASLSTASVGKFDKKLDGEKAGRPKGKQRTRLPVTDMGKEKVLLDTAVNRVLKRESEGVLNMEKAVRNYITDDQEERRVKKQKTQPKVKGTGKKTAARKSK